MTEPSRETAPAQKTLGETLSVPPSNADVFAWGPVRSREALAALAWTMLADLLIFRTATYVSFAGFLLSSPLLFRIAAIRSPKRLAIATCGFITLLVILRLLWLGSPLSVFSGIVMIVAFAMVVCGAPPRVMEGLAWIGRTAFDGPNRLGKYRWTRRAIDEARTHHQASATLLPILAVLVFGSIFILANPDLVNWSRETFVVAWDQIQTVFSNLSMWEIPFCLTALVIGIGLMRPSRPQLRFGGPNSLTVSTGVASPMYAAYRNTLIVLTLLFGFYLAFEFRTLWRREFPEGFYYAGYAHQGAAWLTIALMISTASLSVIFGRSLLKDSRLSRMRLLAWFWSAENFLLAAAVYNRLMIYVGYNGMTRMRWVGFFGISLVVVGFALVVLKIARNRSFWWLIRGQLLALILFVIAYSLAPIDYLAHRYNTLKVAGGNPRPSVMLAVKPLNDEGYLALLSLSDHDEAWIRDGVRARLTRRHRQLEEQLESSESLWTYQASTRLLYRMLNERPDILNHFANESGEALAYQKFRDRAMRWY